jgi:hypothetical protein
MMDVAMWVSSSPSPLIIMMRRMAFNKPCPEAATAKLTVASTINGTMPAAMADSTRTLVVWGR